MREDLVLVEGLPAMTVERTLADLVEDVSELSLIANALRDASRRRNLDFTRLEVLLKPLAARNGLPKNDGQALLEHLKQLAGIDDETRARRIASDWSLGPRVAKYYEEAAQSVAKQLNSNASD